MCMMLLCRSWKSLSARFIPELTDYTGNGTRCQSRGVFCFSGEILLRTGNFFHRLLDEGGEIQILNTCDDVVAVINGN